MNQSRQGSHLQLWLLTGCLTLAAAGVGVVVFGYLKPSVMQPHLTWWILTPIFFFANRSGIRLYTPRTSLNSGITEVPLVLALFFSTPADLLIAFTVGQLLVELTRPVHVPWRIGFAISLHLLMLLVAYLVFRLLAPNPHASDPAAWGATGAAILAYNLRVFFASTAVKLAAGKRPPQSDLRVAVAYSFGSASVGILAAILIAANPASVIWLLPVVIAIGISSRIHGSEFSQRQALEILAGTDANLAASMDFEATIHVIASRLRMVFRARMAQITLFVQPPSAKAFRTTVDLDEGDELMSPVAADIPPVTLNKRGGGALISAKSQEEDEIDLLQRHRINEALIAPIVSRGRTVGYIVIGGHADEKDSTYKQAQLTALQSLAIQAGQLLENRQLAAALAELSQREAELTYRAFHDSLTGLATRPLLVDRLGQLLAGPRQEASWLVVHMDVDELAAINRHFGRAAGDYVLVALAQALTGQLGDADTGARVAGDELVAIVRIDSFKAEAVARDIAASLEAPKTYGAHRLEATVCFGATLVGPSDTRTVWQVLEAAEAALARAKGAGKGYAYLDEQALPTRNLDLAGAGN